MRKSLSHNQIMSNGESHVGQQIYPSSARGEHSHRGVHPGTLLPSNSRDRPLPLSVTRECGRVWRDDKGLHPGRM